MARPAQETALLVRAGGRICAFRIDHVIETMRPLPVTPLSGTPAFVRGASVVRGEAVPVIDLDALLGTHSDTPAARLVRVRCGARTAAVAVHAVLGVAQLPPSSRGEVPLLAHAASGAIEALGARDRELLVVLDAARIVPDEVWPALAPSGEAR